MHSNQNPNHCSYIPQSSVFLSRTGCICSYNVSENKTLLNCS